MRKFIKAKGTHYGSVPKDNIFSKLFDEFEEEKDDVVDE